jgi:hypothetical protein
MRLLRKLGRFAVILLVSAVVAVDAWFDYMFPPPYRPLSTEWIIVGCSVLLIWLTVETCYWRSRRRQRKVRTTSSDEAMREALRHLQDD